MIKGEDMSDEALRRAALEYHAAPRPGKIGTHVFKPAELEP
jgi:hypothetical protein